MVFSLIPDVRYNIKVYLSLKTAWMHYKLWLLIILVSTKLLPQAFSSEPSAQSSIPLQKSPFSIQTLSPHASKFSSQSDSGVLSRGWTFLSLVIISQFFTAHFQSQVCFSKSKARPGGQRSAWRPWNIKRLRNVEVKLMLVQQV